ncbi:MAG: molybdopterin-dependent oxidoreductase [Candidatus Bathyarchaeota archaeon]|nr:molybdopterin-dependent oxidoreductase [Candidatus Bathyarchaeota archaeon]
MKGIDMARASLPPGQREIRKVPLRHIGIVPEFDLELWRLEVCGEVEKPVVLSFEDVKALPSVVCVSDFHCVEGWSLLNNRWKGVSFKVIVELVKPKAGVECVVFECYDGYLTSLSLSDLLKDGVLLAYKLDGEWLTRERGGSLRLVVPHKYAYKSPMWLKRIKFTSEQELGYWEKRGYSNTADLWKEERYAK